MQKLKIGFAIAGIAALAACSAEEPTAVESEEGVAAPEAQAAADDAFAWPDSLRVIGDGYPSTGDPCRRVGETAATSNYLDDSAMLVGCPGDSSSAAAIAITEGGNAHVVGVADGVTLISVDNAPAPVAAAPANAGPTNFSGSITGNALATHRFSANEGDTVNVTLDGSGTMYFNVLPPGGSPGDAIYVGSRAAESADFWSGVAPTTGEYSIIIYLMGNDRDSGTTRSYDVTVAKN